MTTLAPVTAPAPSPPPPENEEELRLRARRLAGWTLAELARHLGERAPGDLRRAKGWVGEALERALGASSGSQPEPDFPSLGVELKTIPVGPDGLPIESTYVSTVPLVDHAGLSWEGSLVRRKLCRVLFMPVEGARHIPVAERRLGAPLFWSPTPDEEAVLRRDFEELMEMVCLGEVERLSAHYGTYLQVRPKAANAQARTAGVGIDGRAIETLPRGFYLRATFTAELLRRHFLLP